MMCLLLLDQQKTVEGVKCQLYRECLFSQSLLFYLSLYDMGLDTPMTDKEDYKEMARLLPENYHLVFFNIFVLSIQSSYILYHTDKISKDDINYDM